MSFDLMMDLIADQSFDDKRLKICERFLDDKMSAGETLTARRSYYFELNRVRFSFY